MRVISFDVFDTLLTRTSAVPHDLFVRLGARLHARGLVTLPEMEWARARADAEHRARRSVPHGEVLIEAIYAELRGPLGWDAATAASVLTEEIALEEEGLRGVSMMLATVASARLEGARILFISDTYFASALVRRWLEGAGFWERGDTLFVSSEWGASKGLGTLYPKIRDEIGADFAAWTHHGDNPASDVALPRKLGITVRAARAATLSAREETLRGPARFAPPWRSLLAGAARLARLERLNSAQGTSALADVATDVAGPLFYGFVDWCLAEAERRGIAELYFASRGGLIFLRIAEQIQAVRPRAVRLRYLHVSRLALSGTEAGDHAALRRLAAPRVVFHSARQTLANLELHEGAIALPNWLVPGDLDRNLTPLEREQLADWLLEDPSRRRTVEAGLALRAQRARTYLLQAGLASSHRKALVDTGWRGTIHRGIDELLRTGSAPSELAGFYLGLISEGQADFPAGWLGYANTFSPLPLRDEPSQCVLLELLSQADHGQVLGYAPDANGRMTPQLAPMNDASRQQARLLQEAILAFGRRALEAGRELADAPPDALARAVIDAWRQFAGDPSRDEALSLGRLPHCDQFFEQRPAMLCPPMGLAEVLTAILDWRRRPPGWWLAGQARLGHGFLIRPYMVARRVKCRFAAGKNRLAG